MGGARRDAGVCAREGVGMTYRDIAILNTKEFEGLRLTPYRDSVGVWTIGYGTNLEALGVDIRPGCTLKICKEQALAWLNEKLDEAEAGARSLYPRFDEYSDVVKATLIDLCYNLGVTRLGKFVNTNAAINEGRWNDAADGLAASKYAQQVGRRARYHVTILRNAAG